MAINIKKEKRIDIKKAKRLVKIGIIFFWPGYFSDVPQTSESLRDLSSPIGPWVEPPHAWVFFL